MQQTFPQFIEDIDSMYVLSDTPLRQDSSDSILFCQIILQVAQLSQRDRAAGWVSNGQKWKTGTERQYLRTM